jgi:hypothetical protein
MFEHRGATFEDAEELGKVVRDDTPGLDVTEYPLPPLPLGLDERVTTRSELDLATEFLGEHQVVEALERGERPLVTYTILAMPDGQTRVMFTGHTDSDEELKFAHCMLLDTVRRQFDRVEGEGEAARLLFIMAATPSDTTTTVREDDTTIGTVDLREQPGPDPEGPGEGVPHDDSISDSDDDDDEE